ncbi:dihydrodipicolinate synthase family protein [Mucilaginibacter robiniae]|uniref:Dihydrodipicolinate synthase family protein n=1 Tax=Mucilaginibacter robiniae TaxID=2728022 RepID=A0A7L5E4F0_9SPHI|nr:dihydrodipicolinate synthase family protein [Mucilaginibacter robiniae]QJD97267.1 dihydrodipicolinate synthase family protein [Mucilaginibacter robiniae]
MRIHKRFGGTVVPVVTPLTSDYRLDEEAVEKIFTHLANNEAMPFILGTTGEAASLSAQVKSDYLRKAASLKSAGAMLYVGISSNSFDESVQMAKRSFDLGASAVAATLPAYYNLSEDQIRKYLTQLADQVSGPLIIYNIPATTHMSIPLHLIDELSHHENVVAVKDSERSQKRLDESLQLWAHRPDFSYLLGWAAKSAYALLNGGDGLIPSTGNVTPEIYCEMVKAVQNGDADKAYQYQQYSDQLGALYQSGRLLGESLWALKVLMQEVGLCQPNMMPPLHKLADQEAAEIKQSFHALLQQEGITLNKYNHV